jgi:hypothetical protein
LVIKINVCVETRRDTQRQRQTDRQTDRQRERERERERVHTLLETGGKKKNLDAYL